MAQRDDQPRYGPGDVSAAPLPALVHDSQTAVRYEVAVESYRRAAGILLRRRRGALQGGEHTEADRLATEIRRLVREQRVLDPHDRAAIDAAITANHALVTAP